MARRKKALITLKKNLPPTKAIIKPYRDEIRKDVTKVGKRGLTQYKRIVGNWSASVRPDFNLSVSVLVSGVIVRIYVKEKDKDKPVWLWIDKTGTKSHKITPRKPGGKLAFNAGTYAPKTSPNPARFGGPGSVQNPTFVVVPEVNHPGFPPRRFSDQINKDMAEPFRKAIYNGGRRGLRRAKKAA